MLFASSIILYQFELKLIFIIFCKEKNNGHTEADGEPEGSWLLGGFIFIFFV